MTGRSGDEGPEVIAAPGRAGRLVVVGTPLGNLGDLSPRGRAALEAADVVACEDTRRTGRLLQLSGIGHRRLILIEEHVEREGGRRVVDAIGRGAVVALVSDAGMPGVSDPGALVVSDCLDAGIHIEVVPGPTALTTALALSGFSGDRFVFEGFLPRRGGDRSRRLAAVAGERSVVVCHEAPHRVARTLTDLAAACGGERIVTVCRELTKLHEEVWRGTLAEAVRRFGDEALRGEFVLVVGPGAGPAAVEDAELVGELRARLARGDSRRGAIDAVAAAAGVSRSRVYRLALDLERPGT